MDFVQGPHWYLITLLCLLHRHFISFSITAANGSSVIIANHRWLGKRFIITIY